MALRKNPSVDLKLHYKRTIEISMIISISLLITAFSIFPKFSKVQAIADNTQEVWTLEDVVRTNQQTAPPPPPQPQIPIESPSDVDIPDIEIASNELDPEANVTKQPVEPPKINSEADVEPPFIPFAEKQPEPVGGMDAIYKVIVYPPLALRAGIQGKVNIYAYVDRNGNVIKSELIKGIGGGCDEEALNKIKLIKFNPGMQGGRPVNVKLAMQIHFMITN